ncbi:hypothetical protein K8T06_06600 [bacterium]|nr:hypothetical protein [bacterium]
MYSRKSFFVFLLCLLMVGSFVFAESDLKDPTITTFSIVAFDSDLQEWGVKANPDDPGF